MKQIISQMSFNVHQKSIIYPSTSLLCAISGGQDSILLLFILVHLRETLNLHLELIYCHHFWQRNNFYSLVHIFNLAYLLNIPIHITFAEVDLNSEQIGHNWRRKQFFRVGAFSNSKTILTAHTGSDQIETAIWHLLRGTSPTGLISLKQQNSFHLTSRIIQNNCFPNSFKKGNNYRVLSNKKFYNKQTWSKPTKQLYYTIALESKKYNIDEQVFSKKVKVFSYRFFKEKLNHLEILRPLIEFHRDDITKIVKHNKLPIYIDKTNQSLQLNRNKIRLLLLPLFRFYFKTNCDLQIKKYLNITIEEQEFLNPILLKILQSFCDYPETIKSLFQLPLALQYKIIQLILEIYTFKQINQTQIQNISNYR